MMKGVKGGRMKGHREGGGCLKKGGRGKGVEGWEDEGGGGLRMMGMTWGVKWVMKDEGSLGVFMCLTREVG